MRPMNLSGYHVVERLALEGRRHAEAKLRDLVRAAHAERTTESGSLGDQILAAVEALPDESKLQNLPDDIRNKLEDAIVQFEIQYHADQVIKTLEEKKP
jgi:hypothetical protein